MPGVCQFGVFALITSEFQVAALMNIMAADLHISLPMTGYLITVYALAMAIGGPLLALLLLKQPPRRSLLMLLMMFIASQAFAAVAVSYLPLMIARILTGAVAGAFIGNLAGWRIRFWSVVVMTLHTSMVTFGLMLGSLLGGLSIEYGFGLSGPAMDWCRYGSLWTDGPAA